MAAGRNGVALAALAVALVLVMAAAADVRAAEVEASAEQCSASVLYPCLRAIQGARPAAPSRECCAVVKRADKTCMCRQLKASSFPAQMVSNALRLPKKCGRTDLRGFKCGRYTFPY